MTFPEIDEQTKKMAALVAVALMAIGGLVTYSQVTQIQSRLTKLETRPTCLCERYQTKPAPKPEVKEPQVSEPDAKGEPKVEEPKVEPAAPVKPQPQIKQKRRIKTAGEVAE